MTSVLSTNRHARYRIAWVPLAQAYKIVDEQMGGEFCALPDRDGNLMQLRFRTGSAARDWLSKCSAQ